MNFTDIINISLTNKRKKPAPVYANLILNNNVISPTIDIIRELMKFVNKKHITKFDKKI